MSLNLLWVIDKVVWCYRCERSKIDCVCIYNVQHSYEKEKEHKGKNIRYILYTQFIQRDKIKKVREKVNRGHVRPYIPMSYILVDSNSINRRIELLLLITIFRKNKVGVNFLSQFKKFEFISLISIQFLK